MHIIYHGHPLGDDNQPSERFPKTLMTKMGCWSTEQGSLATPVFKQVEERCLIRPPAIYSFVCISQKRVESVTFRRVERVRQIEL